MTPQNRRKLSGRIIKAAEAALAAKNYVSPVDVLVGIGWLDPASLKRWQQGQVTYLERVVQANLSRISEAMKLFRSWATAKGLVPKETHYIARTPRRQTLCFSKSGNPTIEQLYRTHWLSGELSERKRQRLAEKASHSAFELPMDVPPMRRHRGSFGDGESGPSVLAMRRSRRS